MSGPDSLDDAALGGRVWEGQLGTKIWSNKMLFPPSSQSQRSHGTFKNSPGQRLPSPLVRRARVLPTLAHTLK